MKRRPTEAEAPEPAAELAIVAERLSKRYRLTRRPAVGALTGEPDEDMDVDDADDVDDELEVADDPWEGRVLASRGDRPTSVWALRDASFAIRSGSAVGVVGANGAGKTTLLRVLAGITPPTSGRVVIRGRVAPAVEFASAFLQPELSGRQNVLLLAQVFGAPRRVAERAMDDIAAFAELGPLFDVPAKRYSSGLYRRLAISTALNLEPDILLTDEVFAGGDASFRQRCGERLADARRQGLTVVMASHNLDLLRTHCDEGLWLDRGRVAAQGALEDVLAAYADAGGRRRGRAAAPATEPTPTKTKRRRSSSVDAELLGGALFGVDGVAVETLRTDEDALLGLAYEVLRPGVRVQCVVALTADGERVLELVQPDRSLADEPGTVTALVHLPAGSLAPSYYTALVGASVVGADGETSLIAPEAFSFEVYPGDEEEDDPEPAAALLPGTATWTVVPG